MQNSLRGRAVLDEVPRATVLYGDSETSVDAARVDGDQLWLTLGALESATGWDLEPEGVCKGGVCVPVPDARRSKPIYGELFNPIQVSPLTQPHLALAHTTTLCYSAPAPSHCST